MKGRMLLNYLVFLPISIVVGIYSCIFIFSHDWNKSDLFIAQHIRANFPSSWEFEDKVKFITKFLSYVSIIFLGAVVKTFVLRLLTLKSNPQADPDNVLIIALNKIIQNTMEQLIVFGCFLCYWVFSVSNENNKNEATLFALAFLVGRVYFIVGMFFLLISGTAVIRGMGATMNLLVCLLLLAKCFPGCPEVSKIVGLII